MHYGLNNAFEMHACRWNHICASKEKKILSFLFQSIGKIGSEIDFGS